jgi:hypothetical protein
MRNKRIVTFLLGSSNALPFDNIKT